MRGEQVPSTGGAIISVGRSNGWLVTVEEIEGGDAQFALWIQAKTVYLQFNLRALEALDEVVKLLHATESEDRVAEIENCSGGVLSFVLHDCSLRIRLRTAGSQIFEVKFAQGEERALASALEEALLDAKRSEKDGGSSVVGSTPCSALTPRRAASVAQMTQRIYYQCPLGHYSSGMDGCWFDHWLQPPLPAHLRGDLGSGPVSMTLSALVSAGVPADALPHVLLVDFGASESAFDGMIPLSFMRGPSQTFAGLDGWNPGFPAGFSTVDGTKPVLYFRCNGGHYFSGSASCPLDGWCESGTESILSAFSEMVSRGATPRPGDVAHGAATRLLKRVIVAQFGDPLRAVRGIVPMIYHDKGRTYLERDLPLEFL